MDVLTVCAGCSRHVKFHEALCPFCGAVMGERAMPMVDTDPGAPRGLSRGRRVLAAAVTVGASVSMAACYGESPWVTPDDPSYFEPITHCERVGDEALCGLEPATELDGMARPYLGRIALMEARDRLRRATVFAAPTMPVREGAAYDGGVCSDPLARQGVGEFVRRVLVAAVNGTLRSCTDRSDQGVQMVAELATAQVCGAQSVSIGPGLDLASRGVGCDPATGAPRQGYEGFGVVTAVYLASVAGTVRTGNDERAFGLCPTAVGWAPIHVTGWRSGGEYGLRRQGWSVVRLTPLRTVCAALYPRRP